MKDQYKMCRRKRRYSVREAHRVAGKINARQSKYVHGYRCPICRRWHVGGDKFVNNKMKRNDIIQITDKGHPWYPALAVIEEVKSWGALAYVWMIDNTEDTNGQAYIRLKAESFETVGSAVIVNTPSTDAEEQ